MNSFKWISGAILVQMIVSVSGIRFRLSDGFVCEYAPGLTVGNRSRELQCCENLVSRYYNQWSFGKIYLSSFLEALQTWNCSQFKAQCDAQLFSYTNFTSLLYLRFCNRTDLLEAQCYGDVRSAVEAQTGRTLAANAWNDAVRNLNEVDLSDEDLLKPCLQVAMYDVNSSGYGHYHEVIEPVVPFCSFVWCGFSESIVEARHISTWTCMPSRCQASVILVMVVFGLLGIATFVCNATILGVLLFNNKLQNGQAIYRLSLAFADILVGAIVFPTFISTVNKYLIDRHGLGELRNVTGYVRINNTVAPIESSMVELRENGGNFGDRFSRSYLNGVGFFTVLSLSVSVYTLVAAGADRFVAINKPLRYSQRKAIFAAKSAVACIWIAGILFATLPLYVGELRYGVVAAILISSGGLKVLILYSVAFFIPLILMWILTITTFVVAKSKSSEWSTQTVDNGHSQMELEMQLFRTLGVMVGVFTLCLLPAAIVLLVGIYLTDIYFQDPINLNEQSSSHYTAADVVVVILLTSNSLWNCFIYSARDPHFRKASSNMYLYIARALRLDYVWSIVARRDNLAVQRHASEHIRQESVSSAATEATKVFYKNDQVDMKYDATTKVNER